MRNFQNIKILLFSAIYGVCGNCRRCFLRDVMCVSLGGSLAPRHPRTPRLSPLSLVSLGARRGFKRWRRVERQVLERQKVESLIFFLRLIFNVSRDTHVEAVLDVALSVGGCGGRCEILSRLSFVSMVQVRQLSFSLLVWFQDTLLSSFYL